MPGRAADKKDIFCGRVTFSGLSARNLIESIWMKPFELLALSGSRSSGGAPLSHLQVYRGLTTRAAAVSNAPPFCNKYKEKLSMQNVLSAMALFGVMVVFWR